jgi:hypothetical protein
MSVQNVQEVAVNLSDLFVYLYISLPDLATLCGYDHVTKSRILSLIILCYVKFTISDISGSSVDHLIASFGVHKITRQGRGRIR